ncbi:MAG: hypothetical protein HYX43_10460 [Burkholderiales bacterium]|nr:hypothetical protein [Burkholderiales bacterium]
MPQTAIDDPTLALLSTWLWPLNALKAWLPLVSLAPQALTQPILPNLTLGNVYNVTETNSSAPQTELEVVSHHSYGRQLGRITDALSVVIRSGVLEKEELSDADRKRLDDFLKLAQSIEEIKTREAMKRIERVAAELAHLKQTRPDDFQRAVELLDPIMRG